MMQQDFKISLAYNHYFSNLHFTLSWVDSICDEEIEAYENIVEKGKGFYI